MVSVMGVNLLCPVLLTAKREVYSPKPRRPEVTNLIFNFDGTVQSGVGGPTPQVSKGT
jgi:hypothetical protein